MSERSQSRNLSRADRQGRVALPLKERILVEGVAVDCGKSEFHEATRNRDDAFWLRIPDFDDPSAPSHFLTVSITDVASVVPKDSSLDKYAFKGTKHRPMFPKEVLDEDLTLKSGQPRPTVSTTIPLSSHYDSDSRTMHMEGGIPVIQLTRLQLERAGKLTHEEVTRILRDPKHKMFPFFTDCVAAATQLRNKRRPDAVLATDSDTAVPSMVVEEFMSVANAAIRGYLVEKNEPAIFQGRQNGYTFYTPVFRDGHTLRATSPMWQYDALVNQRVLTTVSRGGKSPYSARELNDICRYLNGKNLSDEQMREVYRAGGMAIEMRKKVTDIDKRLENNTREAAGEKPERRTVYLRRKNAVPNGGVV